MPLTYRLASEADLPAIVQLLADDVLGAQREAFQLPLPDSYQQAFRVIHTDPQQELAVVELDGEIVATFQLTFIQYLTYQGGIRAQIEAVRVKDTHRGQGIGAAISSMPLTGPNSGGPTCCNLPPTKNAPMPFVFMNRWGL